MTYSHSDNYLAQKNIVDRPWYLTCRHARQTERRSRSREISITLCFLRPTTSKRQKHSYEECRTPSSCMYCIMSVPQSWHVSLRIRGLYTCQALSPPALPLALSTLSIPPSSVECDSICDHSLFVRWKKYLQLEIKRVQRPQHVTLHFGLNAIFKPPTAVVRESKLVDQCGMLISAPSYLHPHLKNSISASQHPVEWFWH